MIDTESVRDALGGLERFAPAEADVLAGMREGIVRRRRRRQVVSVAAVAGTAAAVALGVVVLIAPGERGGTNEVAAPPTPASSAQVPVESPPAEPRLPFSVGWVPAGYTLQTWEARSTEGSAQYVATRDFEVIVVSISAQPHTRIEGTTEEPTEVAGRPGVLRTLPDGADDQQLIWQLADGRWAMVGGMTPIVPLDALYEVAASVSGTPTAMETGWTLGAMPDGYEVGMWSAGTPKNPTMMLCPPDWSNARDASAQQPSPCVSVSVHDGTAPAMTQRKTDTNGGVVDVPVDQEEVVNGLLTRATADGTLVVAQLDPGHWVGLYSGVAKVDVLRAVASSVVIK